MTTTGNNSGTNVQLVAAVDTVTRFLVSDLSLQDTLDRVAQLTCDAIAPAAAIGVTLVDDQRRPRTFVSTADVAPVIDQAQYEEEQGPCLDAYGQRRTIRVDDTRTVVDRWPRFGRAASQHGVLSVLALPLTVGEETYGAVNLYATHPEAFTAADEADARLFSTQIAVVLGNARAYWGVYEMAEGLKTAMQSRASIEQAKGIMMASRRCGPDEAFMMLIGASQRSNVKLRVMADRLVASCRYDAVPPAGPVENGFPLFSDTTDELSEESRAPSREDQR